jgi:hypothetical protein
MQDRNTQEQPRSGGRLRAMHPGGRPHIQVGPDAPLASFEALALRYPVFRFVPAGTREDRRTTLAREGSS